jgi:hypothetical protein
MPPESQPFAPGPATPTVHVMAMWEPSAPQPTEQAAMPAEPTAVARRRPRVSKSVAPKGSARTYADPFAPDDGGANCIRCGYLVEPVREQRGLLTCSACR